jgi:hypothetical protein
MTAYINVLRRCRLNLWVSQFKSSNLCESRQPSQLLAHSFQTLDTEAVGSLLSSLFLYWYINRNKNLNGISFSLYFRKVTFLRRFTVRVELLTLHVYLSVPECTRISNVS